MTKIDELMRLATDLCVAQMKTSAEYVDAYETLERALEAALKPGEPYAWVVKDTGLFIVGPHRPFDNNSWQPVYTAPPAQKEN
jgi:hypothetical protein